MSFFSPITSRSRLVKFLFGGIYLVLALGALTMLVPLLVAITGSMSGPSERRSFSLYPDFLFSEAALWSRYVEARYGGMVDNLRMAWGDPSVDFYEIEVPGESRSVELKLWQRFLEQREPLSPQQAGLAFTRSTHQNASYQNRCFREWLIAQYGPTLNKVNETLGLEAPRLTAILPPIQNRIVLAEVKTPLVQAFDEYLKQVSPSFRMPWDVGNFYRAVYLPRFFGTDIAKYNERFRTSYKSFSEIPFPVSYPREGGELWLQFVSQILNTDFVGFTPEGEAACAASGLSKVDFIRMKALPEYLVVSSIDTEFEAWAARQGVDGARIPQLDIDWRYFQAERGFWKREFVIQNFRYVLEEVFIQGNGVRNTFVLVVLSVLGVLTVNPAAAYALSRFKLRQSYQILLFFLATIAFPAEVAMIPNFIQIKELGMINTFGALVIPGLVNGFSIFLLKGFFDSLPRELYEAADIDGASEWQIFWGITMSLSKPILAVIALGAFTSAYGAFMFALILAPDPSMWTLMVWIYQLQQSAGSGIVYASVLITAIPTLVVYLFTQNLIMRGIVVPTDK